MAAKRFNRPSDFFEVILVLATLPALGVGIAAYSFNFDAIRLIAWLFGGDVGRLWGYFWYYALAIFMTWILVGVFFARRGR